MSLALIAALPFLGALLPSLMIRAGRNACAMAAGSATLLALVGLLIHAPAVFRGEVVHTRIDWLPQLGLNANFFLDGLGLMFAGLILGIGLLIILYARFYLAKTDPMGQFYTYLMLFQGAMTGIVLSDNILLLLVFWELTSLTSFLLIGYWKHAPESRQGARMALAVTGMGGLAMIAGMLILGGIAGSFDISVILTMGPAIQASEWYLPALLLILTGCFTKSAQFPFHFWLPHAMAAPTPVSAYLHSATMVKAGLFLMARLWPVLSGTGEWFAIVASVGLVTMVLAAVIGLYKNDLKALLAYSTVSHLGLVTMLLGFGTEAAVVVAVFHIINHATFKAALFMAAGIVDHEAHTRDIRRLGGLRRLMPVTFAITTIAALSMAGIPPLNGFLSKEMMLKAAVETSWAGSPWLLPALATLGAAFSVAYSFRLVAHVFLGPVRSDYPHHPHDPGFGLWAAPALLAGLVVLIGLLPMTLAGDLVGVVAGAVTGAEPAVSILHWHGPIPALFLSVAAVGGGLVLLGLHRPLAAAWDAAPRPQAKAIFDGLVEPAARLARGLTDALHDGAFSRYAFIFFVVTLAAGIWAFALGGHAPGLRPATPVDLVPLAGWFLLVAASAVLVAFHRDRLVAVVVIAVVGLTVALTFAYFSAPDLAMTQILVEVATVVLLLLALYFLPKRTPRESGALRRLRDGAVAGVAGLAVAGLAYAIMTRDFAFPTVSAYHIANSLTLGGGSNVVNVILVDFRAYDTFGELLVLAIAALVIVAVTEALLRGPAGRRLALRLPDQAKAGDRYPVMLVVAARLALPIVLMAGIYLYWRGHNFPGGGFIAGLVIGLAVLMQYLASGLAWAETRQRIDWHGVIAVGALVAAGCGIGAFLADRPLLTSSFGAFQIPPLGELKLSTALIFDLGVVLVVVGAVMLALVSLSRLAIRDVGAAAQAPPDIAPTAPPAAREA
jgi:multicomponent K+:H+ antiporter subunit A